MLIVMLARPFAVSQWRRIAVQMNTITNNNFEAVTKAGIVAELNDATRTIEHCIGQLSTEQVWRRPAPEMNGIGNLILHVAGNIRQWIIAGVGGAQDTRNRPEEFAEQGPIEPTELMQRLHNTVAEANRTIESATTPMLTRQLAIQGFRTNGVAAVLHSMSHFRGHVQEIIHLTRSQLGDAYEFKIVPKSSEQGAPQA